MDVMNARPTRAMLSRHWVHSHEEDTDTEKVYRPSDFPFPRSRGRASFELRVDGTLKEFGIGSTDRPQESEGTWEFDNGDTLKFFSGIPHPSTKVLRIASADENKLVIRK
jgi:hypothetical protein